MLVSSHVAGSRCTQALSAVVSLFSIMGVGAFESDLAAQHLADRFLQVLVEARKEFAVTGTARKAFCTFNLTLALGAKSLVCCLHFPHLRGLVGALPCAHGLHMAHLLAR